MKKFLYLIAVFILCITVYGCLPRINLFMENGRLMGILPVVSGRVVYQERVPLNGMPKQEAYKRARRWWVNTYRSPKDVFQLDDKETGEIVGKGYGRISFKQNPRGLPTILLVRHVISFDIQDDAYLITVSGLVVEELATNKYTYLYAAPETPVERYNIISRKYVLAFFRALDKETLLTIDSIKNYIKSPTPY